MYTDRRDAGRKLAAALRARPRAYDGGLVLGIPRGGLEVADEVARALGCEFDIVAPRKLPAPFNEELAVGAVAEDGTVYIDPRAEELGIGTPVLEAITARQVREIHRRLAAYRGDRRAPVIAGRVVIVVDDGIATGSTMIAALRSLRARGARPLLAGVPIAPPNALELLAGECDEVVCPWVAPQLGAVGQAYEDFPQVSDDEVLRILRAAWRDAETHGASAPPGS
jgi:putative phosphoribosyl transferase